NFLDHNGIGADPGILADRERTKHFGARANHDSVFQRRVTFARVPTGPAQGHPLVNGAIITDDCRFPYGHAEAMINEESPANRGSRVNFYPGQPARQVRNKPGKPLEVPVPEAMSQPVTPQRMQPRIAKDHLPGTACGGITLENRLQILAETSKHGLSHPG